MDFSDGLLWGSISIVVAILIVILLFGLNTRATAEFICETHGLELISFEEGNPTFKKVECGKTIQTDNYKVFTT